MAGFSGPSLVSASATSGPDLLALTMMQPAAALRAGPNGGDHEIRIRLNRAVVLGFDKMADESYLFQRRPRNSHIGTGESNPLIKIGGDKQHIIIAAAAATVTRPSGKALRVYS